MRTYFVTACCLVGMMLSHIDSVDACTLLDPYAHEYHVDPASEGRPIPPSPVVSLEEVIGPNNDESCGRVPGMVRLHVNEHRTDVGYVFEVVDGEWPAASPLPLTPIRTPHPIRGSNVPTAEHELVFELMFHGSYESMTMEEWEDISLDVTIAVRAVEKDGSLSSSSALIKIAYVPDSKSDMGGCSMAPSQNESGPVCLWVFLGLVLLSSHRKMSHLE